MASHTNVSRTTGKKGQNAPEHPDTSFSDPVDVSSSDAESFNEDDMYGSDHGIDTVCESSDDGNQLNTSRSADGKVSLCTFHSYPMI